MSSPWPRARTIVWQRRQGRPARSYTQVAPGRSPGKVVMRPPRSADARISGRMARTIASASSSGTSAVGFQGSTPAMKHGLRLPDVADPGQVALVQQGVADAPRRVVLAQAAQEPLLVELGGQRCRGPSPAMRWSKRVRESVVSSSTGPSNCTTSCSGVRMTSHARRGGAAPALAVAVDAPLAGHAQVGVQRQVALEADEQVLAVGVHAAHGAARQALGPAVGAVARVRGLDRLDLGAHKRGADASRGVVDRVALGHGPKRLRSAARWPITCTSAPPGRRTSTRCWRCGRRHRSAAADVVDTRGRSASSCWRRPRRCWWPRWTAGWRARLWPRGTAGAGGIHRLVVDARAPAGRDRPGAGGRGPPPPGGPGRQADQHPGGRQRPGRGRSVARRGLPRPTRRIARYFRDS